MFLCFRRLSTPMIYLSDILVFNRPVVLVEIGSVLLILIGTFVSGYNDMNSDWFGYLLIIGNNIMTVIAF